MFKKVALAVCLIMLTPVVVVLAIAASKPDVLHIERSASIKAAPDKLFALLSDFHQWIKWSPFDEKDPNLKRTFSGAEKGKGAMYEWNGNSDVGSGQMEIVEAKEPSEVKVNLHFVKPFEGSNVARFTLVPEGDATKVTWSMDGPNPFMSKLMQVFINMDQMCGKDFEKGLANLKKDTAG